MKTRLMIGLIFQLIQFTAIIVAVMAIIFSHVKMSELTYVLVFGGIILFGLNVLSIIMIVTGSKEEKYVIKTEKEFKY